MSSRRTSPRDCLRTCGPGGVVEECQSAVRSAPGVVLPGKPHVGPEREVASLAAEPPEDLPGSTADLVDRVRVTGRHEQVAVVIDLDRVDVEVVEDPSWVLGQAVVRLHELDVIDAVPLEEHAAGLDVQLLDAALEHPPALHPNLARDRYQGCVPWCDLELVDVRGHPVRRLHMCDEPVGVVVDGIAARSAALVRAAVPPRQDGPSAVSLRAEVRHPVCVEWQEPDDPTAVVEDERSRLDHLFLRCDEDVTGRGPLRALQDLDGRRLQVGARFVPTGRCLCTSIVRRGFGEHEQCTRCDQDECS